MSWLDVGILIIVSWSAWRGFRAGLVGGLARLAGLFLGLIMAFHYYVPLAGYIDQKWHWKELIRGWLPFPPVTVAGSAKPEGPGQEPGLIEQFGQHGLSVLEKIPDFLAQGLLEVVCFLLIFVLVSQLTSWVGWMASHAVRWSFFGPADRLGGLALGVAQGLVIVLVLLILLIPLQKSALSLPGFRQEGWFDLAVGQSMFLPYFQQFLTALQIIFPFLPGKIV